jgi:serine/threonine protein kinase
MSRFPVRACIQLLDAGTVGVTSFLALELVTKEATGLGQLLRQAAAGLDFVHSQGYVHNDVSLDNLLTRQDGTVVLLDFGSAARGGEPAATFGKHRFMSPERISGTPVDGRADQFSLAVVAFERITEKYPFRGEGPTVLNAIVRDPPLPSLQME